ncbi:hypothetical protein ACHAWO_013752 [Cyclotella atomus]
MSLHT